MTEPNVASCTSSPSADEVDFASLWDTTPSTSPVRGSSADTATFATGHSKHQDDNAKSPLRPPISTVQGTDLGLRLNGADRYEVGLENDVRKELGLQKRVSHGQDSNPSRQITLTGSNSTRKADIAPVGNSILPNDSKTKTSAAVLDQLITEPRDHPDRSNSNQQQESTSRPRCRPLFLVARVPLTLASWPTVPLPLLSCPQLV